MCWLGIPGEECPEAAAGAGDGVRGGGGGGRPGEGVRLTLAVVERMFRLTDNTGPYRCPAGPAGCSGRRSDPRAARPRRPASKPQDK